jgi:hypothetical protein
MNEYSGEDTSEVLQVCGNRLTYRHYCSGDFDSVCPLPATRHTVLDLALPVTTAWRPWTGKQEVRPCFKIRIFIHRHDSSHVNKLADGFTIALAGGRICSAVRQWIHISYCARSWSYGSILPARESLDNVELFPQWGATTLEK